MPTEIGKMSPESMWGTVGNIDSSVRRSHLGARDGALRTPPAAPAIATNTEARQFDRCGRRSPLEWPNTMACHADEEEGTEEKRRRREPQKRER